MLFVPTFESASRAVSICAAVELKASGAVVWPPKVSVKVPPVALLTPASYKFVIDGAGTWHVDVDDGSVKVTEDDGEADCTITTSEETFTKIASGEQNPTAAYMSGKLKISGDMGQAMKLQKLF